MRLLLRAIAIGLTTSLATAELVAQTEQTPEVFDTERSGAPLSPQQAAAAFDVPSGFELTLFAAEPDVLQPIAITTDERGRLWVAENYTYAESRVNYDLRFHDRLVILEDTDHDGDADLRKVFWDRGQKLTSVEIGFGGVWVLCAPQLLFIPDRNRDDVPDSEPLVVLDGFNADAIRHNIVNGLKWGPDGWLYGRHGIQATSLVGPPGAAESQRVALNCSIWRYHPTRHVFEVVAHGTTNPWGFDYDDYGQIFFINTVIGHLWHLVPGVHYRRMYGADLKGHLYQLIDQSADHYHWDTGEAWHDIRKGVTDTTSRAGGGHAHCGLMIYLGDNWPERYRNTLFTVNFHGRRLNHDLLVRRDGGYIGRHAPDLFQTTDPWFRGIELIYGADGGVYLADWSDTGECHENDGVHRSSGRIYKITYGQPDFNHPVDLATLNQSDLVQLQLHKNDWYVRHSRRLLQQRASEGFDLSSARAALLDIFKNHDDVTRVLRAMWCLNAIGAIDDSWLVKQLEHPSEHVRLWSVRLLLDRDQPVSLAVVEHLAAMARDDPSALVRLYLASGLQRLPLTDRWEIAAGLVAHREDAEDPALPLMIWYGIEPLVSRDAVRSVMLLGRTQIPTLRRYIARRMTTDIDQRPEDVDHLVEWLGEVQDDAIQRNVLSGMRDALLGWRQAPQPRSWPRVSQEIADDGDSEAIAILRELSVVFGDGRAISDLRDVVTSEGDPDVRRDALRILAQSRDDAVLPLLLDLVNDRALEAEAVRGLAFYHDPDVPDKILARFRYFGPHARREAITTLASRAAYALPLLDAIEAGQVPRDALSAYQARQIRGIGDSNLSRRLVEIWGSVRETPAQKQAEMARIKSLVASEQPSNVDLSNGRLLFNKTCASCHALFGQGGAIGPDLTGSNRMNLDYLLENIIDPSATMIEDFKMSTIILQDGRVITGVVTRRNRQTVTIQTQDESITIPAQDIDEMVRQDRSLMPEGLLNDLSDQQVRDLMGYLSATSQVPLPAESQDFDIAD